MNQSIQKITRYICLFVGVIFLINIPIVLANEKSPYYVKPQIWKGTITIKRIGSAKYKKDKNTVSKTMHSSVYRELDDTVIITVCGEAGLLYIKNVDRNYSDFEEKTFYVRDSLAHCPLPPEAMKHNILYRTKHYPPSIKKPGNSKKGKETIEKNIYTGKDCLSPKAMTVVNLYVFPDGRYTLGVNSQVYTASCTDGIKTETFVCSGNSKVTTVDISTCGFDGEEKTLIGEEGIWSRQHPKLLPLGFTAKRAIENNSIKGDMLIGEIKPKYKGHYKETYSAAWNLKAKDLCKIVYNNLMYDLAKAEAFSDKKIQDSANSIKEYKELVGERAKEIYKSSPEVNPKDRVDSEVRMTATSKCNLKNKDEFKNEVAKRCLPKIIYRATLAHEKRHVYQCKKYHKDYMRGGKKDPRIHGMMEVSAHLRGIKKLFYWLKENCEDHDLTDAKLRIKNLQALPIFIYE